MAVAENHSAGTTADWSTGLFITGALALGAGITMVLVDRPGATAEEGGPKGGAGGGKGDGAGLRPVLAPGWAGVVGRF